MVRIVVQTEFTVAFPGAFLVHPSRCSKKRHHLLPPPRTACPHPPETLKSAHTFARANLTERPRLLHEYIARYERGTRVPPPAFAAVPCCLPPKDP